jgi:hypothetical protein
MITFRTLWSRCRQPAKFSNYNRLLLAVFRNDYFILQIQRNINHIKTIKTTRAFIFKDLLKYVSKIRDLSYEALIASQMALSSD